MTIHRRSLVGISGGAHAEAVGKKAGRVLEIRGKIASVQIEGEDRVRLVALNHLVELVAPRPPIGNVALDDYELGASMGRKR